MSSIGDANSVTRVDPVIAARNDTWNVQVTADGVPVLIHDRDVARISNASSSVEELTRAELEKLDAGHHFTIDERGTTEPDADDALLPRLNAGMPPMLEDLNDALHRVEDEFKGFGKETLSGTMPYENFKKVFDRALSK